MGLCRRSCCAAAGTNVSFDFFLHFSHNHLKIYEVFSLCGFAQIIGWNFTFVIRVMSVQIPGSVAHKTIHRFGFLPAVFTEVPSGMQSQLVLDYLYL